MKKRTFIIILVLMTAAIASLLMLLFDAVGFMADYSVDKAHQQWENGNRQEAINDYRFALSLRPSHKGARIGLAQLYYETGDTQQCEEVLRAGIEWDPEEYDYYAALFTLYRDKGETAPAFELLAAAQGHNVRYRFISEGPQPVTASPSGGEYDKPVYLTLKSDAQIFYTLNGEELSYDSAAYSGEMMLENGTHVLRAFSVNGDGLVSQPVEITYNIEYERERVYFTDRKIEAIVREHIGRPAGFGPLHYIYNTDLFEIRTLSNTQAEQIFEGEIRSLRDLRWMAGLRELSITGEKGIMSFEPIKYLYTLESLNLGECGVSDDELEYIAALTRLEHLSLRLNRITDVAPIGRLTGLRSLDLSGNMITSVEPIATMRLLESLQLGGNSIQNLRPIVSLPLLTELSLYSNAIVDARPLWLMTGLRSLDLRSNSIDDFTGISGMLSLTTLDVSGNPIGGLFAFGSLPSLKILRLAGCTVTSLAPLNQFDFEMLDLSNCNITHASLLYTLGSVRTLILQDNPIDDLTPLSALRGLETLYIERCPVEDLTPLLTCQSLKELYCVGSPAHTSPSRDELEELGVIVH